MSSTAIILRTSVRPLPVSTSWAEHAMLEPLNVVIFAIRRSGLRDGQSVMVSAARATGSLLRRCSQGFGCEKNQGGQYFVGQVRLIF